jgi:hypothetical protein
VAEAYPVTRVDQIRSMNEVAMPSSSTVHTWLAVATAVHHHTSDHHHDSGFLSHVFQTSPWLGTIAVIGCIVYILLKKVGRVFEGTPWYVRLGLLGAAGYGIFRLFGHRRQATSQHPWRAAPPQDPWQDSQSQDSWRGSGS